MLTVSQRTDHLHALRSAELACLFPILSAYRSDSERNPRVLELGSGTGWQAREISERGFSVDALDIDSSIYAQQKVWPVTLYDGSNIPFPDDYFDVIFSSNVLEHIPHLAEFHDEMRRVLRPGGIAVHIVPATAWRLWSNLAHYPFVIRTVLQTAVSTLRRSAPQGGNGKERQDASQSKAVPFLRRLKTILFPYRHGETGNALTEAYWFSRAAWTRNFERGGWSVASVTGNRLMYTGYMTFGPALSIESRARLSRVLGNACHVYVLQENE